MSLYRATVEVDVVFEAESDEHAPRYLAGTIVPRIYAGALGREPDAWLIPDDDEHLSAVARVAQVTPLRVASRVLPLNEDAGRAVTSAAGRAETPGGPDA